MAITNFKISFAGEAEGGLPRLGRMISTDALAVVSAAGYLNKFVLSSGFDLRTSDFIFCVASDGHQLYRPVLTAGSWQLTVLP